MYIDEIDFVRFRPTFGILYMPMQFLEVYKVYLDLTDSTQGYL